MTARALARLSEALGLGDDPERVLGPLRALYRELDAATAAKAGGLELPCRSGCSDCCKESVFLSAPELLLVAEALLALGPERIASVLAEMRGLAERFADELELLETLEPGPERDEVAARVRFRCPLLDASERCSVYEARELNGRAFGQTHDAARGAAYGCERTHSRLRVLGARSERLVGVRALRRALAAAVPGTERVHVYPWWFARYGRLLEAGAATEPARTPPGTRDPG